MSMIEIRLKEQSDSLDIVKNHNNRQISLKLYKGIDSFYE